MIIDFNKNMPPIYQIGTDKDELILYLASETKDDEIQVRKSLKVLKKGTKPVLTHYLEGMIGALDIAKSFQEFEDKFAKVQEGKQNDEE